MFILLTLQVVLRLVQSMLPRELFIRLYKPSTEAEREVSSAIRNAARLADYHAKKALWGVKR